MDIILQAKTMGFGLNYVGMHRALFMPSRRAVAAEILGINCGRASNVPHIMIDLDFAPSFGIDDDTDVAMIVQFMLFLQRILLRLLI